MAVRLRPQSSAWLAPMALAAQLKAQAGESAGAGVAGLLGGVGQGLRAYSANRQRKEEMAINERRYQDSLFRQDRAFQFGAARDQLSLLNEFSKGAEAEVMLSIEASPTKTPDPSKMAALRSAQESKKALMARMQEIAGGLVKGGCSGGSCRAPSAPVGAAPTATGADASAPIQTPPTSPISPGEAAAMRGAGERSDKDLNAAFVEVGGEIERIESVLASVERKTPGTAPYISNLSTRLGALRSQQMLYKAELDKRARAQAEEAEMGRREALARTEAGIKAEADAKELAAINKNREARGLPPIASLREVAPVYAGERQAVGIEASRAKQEDAQAFTRERDETKFRQNLEKIDLQAANTLKRIDYIMDRREKIAATLKPGADPMRDRAMREANQKFNRARAMIAQATDLETVGMSPAERRSLLDDGKREMEEAQKAIDEIEAMPPSAPVAPAPAPAPTADRESAAKRMDAWLAANPGATDEQKRAAWAAIKAGR